ncbi:MAG TPA: beta-galactosidase [Bryobacteraceae bacterium]|nr:beta-galactosidase [Bryobacteraceae bacterium]
MKYFSALITALALPALAAQSDQARRQPFAPDKMDTILYGAAYYPEYMPEDRLEKDVALMQKAGITVVRVGESTWSSWEPRDGEFQFAWMERAIDRLHEAGIRVIVGTPTYSIPTWLYKDHPEIVITHNGSIPALTDAYSPTYPTSSTPGYYGPRQNYDFLNPYFREKAERVIRQIVAHFKDHPAVIGYQIDNETSPTGVPTPYTTAAFVERLKRKYETVRAINRIWGLVYWGQLVDQWEDLPTRQGILNPGYKLEWENFQHDIVTDYLAWQAKIVGEYKRTDQFITQDFSGGAHANIDQWAIARHLDIASENPYFETQQRLDGRGIWFSGDVGRSLKHTNYLVTETNAQSIGWDSRTQFPPYPGQLRQVVYAHLAAGANMVEYWHWSSLHYGQETYWKGILSHDLEPNRLYGEMTEVAQELKRVGPRLVNLKKDNKVAILFSADSANAISYMPFSDRVNYQTILRQMWDALYDLNVEPDFVPAGDSGLSRYRLLLVPPLYSASDEVLQQICDFVKGGGRVIMAFKSGFTDQYSTVRHVTAPGPLRPAGGFHYQEFTNLVEPVRLTPDPFQVGTENKASVWAEFLIPDGAEVLASLDDPNWRSPAVTRNRYGTGTLTYEATVVTDALQVAIIKDAVSRAGLASADQQLPKPVRVRHGLTSQGKLLHYYLNFSGQEQRFSYPHAQATEVLTGAAVAKGATTSLRPWGVAILLEQ